MVVPSVIKYKENLNDEKKSRTYFNIKIYLAGLEI